MTRNAGVGTVLLMAVIALGLFWYLRASLPYSAGFSLNNGIFLQCETIQDKVTRYVCYNEAALHAMRNGGSVEKLAQYALEPSLHLKQHAIGRAILITSGYNLQEAAKKCMPNCVGPYLHAFSEEWGTYAPLRESEFVDFLNGVCSPEKDARCYHNLGHFYFTSHENFQESMALCSELADTDRFYECSYGVVHEQLIQTDGKGFFKLCNNETGRGKTACFTIGSKVYPQWLSHELTGKDPLRLCNEVNREIPTELNYCYASAAWVIENRGKTLDLAWCGRLDAQWKELCIQGLRSPQPFWDVVCRLEGGVQCK